MTEPDWNELIPELRDWNQGRGITPTGWIGCVGNFRLAAAYTTVFWPKFVEVDGMILRHDFSGESLAGFTEQCRGDKSAIESVMNHLHLVDLHHLGCEDATYERLVFIGRTLREIYECKLLAEFPDRDIAVEFDEGRSDDPYSCQITIFQRRR